MVRIIYDNELANENLLFLESWMEIIGTLHKISEDDYFLYLGIDNKVLEFRKGSKQTLCILNRLDDSWIGQNIAILRTDLPDKPILIRRINHGASTK